jgi:hypothetical protein
MEKRWFSAVTFDSKPTPLPPPTIPKLGNKVSANWWVGGYKEKGHMLRPWNNSTQWSQTFENVFKFWRERKNYVNVYTVRTYLFMESTLLYL